MVCGSRQGSGTPPAAAAATAIATLMLIKMAGKEAMIQELTGGGSVIFRAEGAIGGMEGNPSSMG